MNLGLCSGTSEVLQVGELENEAPHLILHVLIATHLCLYTELTEGGVFPGIPSR